MTDSTDDWSGPVCPSCKQEAYRFLSGVCIRCWNKKQANEGKKLELRQFVKNFNRLVKGKG